MRHRRTGLMTGSVHELRVPCSECGNEAGAIALRGGELERTSFTSKLTQPVAPQNFGSLRDLLERGDVAGLYARDPELTPFWCPDCERSYCGESWQPRIVFDDETGALD